jgi:hypothetical protein
MRLLILVLSLTLISTSFAKIYTWKDASGRTVYGDNPPQKQKAKEVITRELTIVEGYKDPYLKQNKANPNNKKSTNSSGEAVNNNEESNKSETHSYESFQITYPVNDESVRANSGNLTAAFSLTPSLNEADTVFVYLDGKKVVEDSKSLSVSFNNLDRGSHSMFAVIRNANGDVLINSNTVSFHILRSSIINNLNQ